MSFFRNARIWRLGRWIALAAFLFVLPLRSVTAADAPIKLIAPRLNVPIPGLRFADHPAVRVGDNLSIPFLSAYIGSIYTYLISISMIAAAIIFVYGGFKYMLSATGSTKDNGKKQMVDAAIGLGLIFGIYTILNVVNSDLTFLKGLSLYEVKKTPFDYSATVLQTTKVETGAVSQGAATESTPSNPSASSQNCPVALTNPLDFTPPVKSPSKDLRTQEFFEKIKPLITQPTMQSRLEFVSNAAINCHLNLGTCYTAGGYMWALAGAMSPDCLQGKICDIAKVPRQAVHELKPTIKAAVETFNCAKDTGCTEKPGCLPQKEALAKARTYLAEQVGDNYPNSWMSDLRAGDVLIIYNGNTSCLGEHTAIFLGWEKDGVARVVQSPGFGKEVNTKTICLKPSCGLWQPLVFVHRSKIQ